MKTFWANSFYSYISRIVIYFPIVSGLILLFDNLQIGIVFLIGGIVASYLLYFCNFCWYLGFLKFTKEFIYTPNDFVPKITRLQYKKKIYYKNIHAIEFNNRDGNSIGKYSHRQWKKIEKEIVNIVPNVLILKSADELIRFRKY